MEKKMAVDVYGSTLAGFRLLVDEYYAFSSSCARASDSKMRDLGAALVRPSAIDCSLLPIPGVPLFSARAESNLP